VNHKISILKYWIGCDLDFLATVKVHRQTVVTTAMALVFHSRREISYYFRDR